MKDSAESSAMKVSECGATTMHMVGRTGCMILGSLGPLLEGAHHGRAWQPKVSGVISGTSALPRHKEQHRKGRVCRHTGGPVPVDRQRCDSVLTVNTVSLFLTCKC